MRMRTSLAALAALLALSAASAAGPGDAFAELVKDFPPKVAEHGDPGPRVDLVTRVAGYDTPEGARLLVAGLAALIDRLDRDLVAYEALRKQYEEVNVPVDVKKDNYRSRTALQNRLMNEDEKQRDDAKVLEAFRAALAKYQEAHAISALSGEIRKLRSPRAQETAAEGLAANPSGMETSIRLGKEEGERVQAAVLRGLRGRNDDAVFDFARDCLKAQSWAVRLEAVLTLEKVNQPRVLPPLIEELAREEGRLRVDVNDALKRLTSQRFEPDPEQWRMWWVDNKSQLEGGGGGTALFGAFKSKGSPPEKKSVYGIESRSRRILFIIDVSGSMKEKIHHDKGGTPTGLSQDQLEELDMTKIDLAKRELKRAVRALEPEALFNILAFSTTVTKWKEKMVKGDMATKNEALTFVGDMEAVGSTWTYGVFQEAFHLAGMGALDKNYDPTVDTIYFISDGAPTDNDMDEPKLQEPEVVLSAVREWNRLGKVIIHAIAIDPRAGGGRFIGFMKKLASENNGQYTQRD